VLGERSGNIQQKFFGGFFTEKFSAVSGMELSAEPFVGKLLGAFFVHGARIIFHGGNVRGPVEVVRVGSPDCRVRIEVQRM